MKKFVVSFAVFSAGVVFAQGATSPPPGGTHTTCFEQRDASGKVTTSCKVFRPVESLRPSVNDTPEQRAHKFQRRQEVALEMLRRRDDAQK